MKIDQHTIHHPLDPLTSEEIACASQIALQTAAGGSARVFLVELVEPARQLVLSDEWEGWDRRARVILREVSEKRTSEMIVSLETGLVVSSQAVDGAQPPLVPEEFGAAEAAVKSDSRWLAAMRARGLEDPALAIVDVWAITPAARDPVVAEGVRQAHCLTWVKREAQDNPYAHPVDGLIVTLDLDEMVVVAVDDLAVVDVPSQTGNYWPESISSSDNVPRFPAGTRSDLRPLDVLQPDGPSFTITGNQVTWQNWSFRVGFSAREGLVLHSLSYVDRGQKRSVLHRAAVSEMFVPYGDPSPTQRLKNAFDAGECGLGYAANSLTLGCDCPNGTEYLDAAVSTWTGEAVSIENAVCMHEEDAGILWKHTDGRLGISEVRRARRFVISMIATVGNYDYGFYWYLYQDGSIEFEAKLTGIISTGAVRPGETPRFGNLVAPGLYGPNHQHFFCVRLDPAIDGAHNSVFECDSVALPPGPDNPRGNAWAVEERLLETERDAQRHVAPAAGRFWKIANRNVSNSVGGHVAYVLHPGGNVLPLLDPSAPALARAGFAKHHLWVTAYDPAERFASGDFPHLSAPGRGLPEYAEQNRSIVDTDLVVWYVFGAHHVVAPEDWPVLPVVRIGFMLKPFGFFDGNASLDVAPSHRLDHCHVH